MRPPRPAINDTLNPADTRRRAEEAAASLPPLLVKAERVATIVAQGEHGRRRAGTGDTFWQYRRYQPGDSVQNIDWRQSAKSQIAFVRENEWEAAQNLYVWVDRSASMHWHSDPDLPTKAERAVVMTLAVASLLIRGGERISLLDTAERPAAGRAVLSRLAAELSRADNAGTGVPPLQQLRRHSRVLLTGDFLDPVHELEHVVRTYSRQGISGHLIQVCDPAEEALPFFGRTRFEGLEGEGTTLIGRVEAAREHYASLRGAHRKALSDVTRSCGWSFSITHTDRPVEPTLLALHMLMAETERA